MTRRALLAALASCGAASARPWSQFLGNGRRSLPDTHPIPLEWSDTSGVAWIAELPGHGQSCPVVLDDAAYVSTVEGKSKETVMVSALDLRTGELRWTSRRESSQRIEESDMVSKAAPTPVADRRAVVAFFETGDVIATDREGKVLWSRSLTDEFGEFGGRHGIGSSLRLCAAGVLALVAHDGPSYLICLDPETGETVWKADRDKGVSWSTPAVVRHGQRELALVTSGDRVDAYDSADGEHLWKMDGFSGAFVASPAPVPGGALIGSSTKGRSGLIRFGKTAADSPSLVWQADEASSYFSSPLLHRNRVYMVNKVGVAFCLDAESGAEVWHARLDGQCWASAIGMKDRIYFFGVDGATTVVRAADEFSVLARNTLSVDGRLYGAVVAQQGLLLRYDRSLVKVTAV